MVLNYACGNAMNCPPVNCFGFQSALSSINYEAREIAGELGELLHTLLQKLTSRFRSFAS